ncbi:2OG-Fe(II) oxygenase superfamily-domain containing protein [Nitzschia inconspicua]|uniref:2OG-Fe(II) oxygenase superfamily-domain containing protein n=1 Tax=Nitzschia inconspicua TaxID=303405 RepID=A0A9K3LYV3_9STRA|nr:2OG-Fe(II) oxygenase superfamily-domain containing protein [Nitzschia inconspicua]
MKQKRGQRGDGDNKTRRHALEVVVPKKRRVLCSKLGSLKSSSSTVESRPTSSTSSTSTRRPGVYQILSNHQRGNIQDQTTLPFVRLSPRQPTKGDTQLRLLLTRKTYDSKSQTWTEKEHYFCCNDKTDNGQIFIPLSRGGQIHIFPNYIDPKTCLDIKTELVGQTNCWRNYAIQGGLEPRLQCLFHEKATQDDSEPQPGYAYAQTTMKARPLSMAPKLQDLSRSIAKDRNLEYFNIGVNCVLYRDNTDSIGDHTDDDQDEERIFCAVIQCAVPRKIQINTLSKYSKTLQHGDEIFDIFLQTGDCYEMDGQMQEYYSHSVPKVHWSDKKNKDRTDQDPFERISVVLRHGTEKYMKKDNGKVVQDIFKPKPTIRYTMGPIENIVENLSYTRPQLKHHGAFQLMQRGISGSGKLGADAIIVTGQRKGYDNGTELCYEAEWSIGGNALCRSYDEGYDIRVFRSEEYCQEQFGPASISDTTADETSSNPNRTGRNQVFYLYGGLFRIDRVEKPAEEKGAYKFHLVKQNRSDTASAKHTPLLYSALPVRPTMTRTSLLYEWLRPRKTSAVPWLSHYLFSRQAIGLAASGSREELLLCLLQLNQS